MREEGVMTGTTCIRNIAWLIAWDPREARHVFRRDVDLAFADDRIAFIGKGYTGATAVEIDGRGLMVCPGLVDIHCHGAGQIHYKGVREDLSNPNFFGSALYDFTTRFLPDEAGHKAGLNFALGELLLSGTTSVVHIAHPVEGWMDRLAASGIRAWVGPYVSCARWRTDGPKLVFDWDEAGGRASLDRAQTLIREAERHPSGRLGGIMAPAEIDTVSEEVLRDSAAVAREAGWHFQVHCSESINQVREIQGRHGMTPVQWAWKIGILGPGTGLGHAIFLDHHSKTHWPTRTDLSILAETETSVAHCPTVFSRYGQTLQDFGRYRRAGITLGIGTDTLPHNMLEEMRTAIVAGRIASGYAESVYPADVLEAATVGGAKMLGRDDIGRLATGAKADLFTVDLSHPSMRPLRDPLRSLIYTAAERPVRDVYVDGRKVVSAGRLTTIDMAEAAAEIEAAQARMEAAVPGLDPEGRSAAELAPYSLPMA